MILLSVNFMRGKLRRAIIFDAAPLMHLLRCSFVKGDYARPTASMTTREKFHLSNNPWQYIASLILLAYIMQTNKQPSPRNLQVWARIFKEADKLFTNSEQRTNQSGEDGSTRNFHLHCIKLPISGQTRRLTRLSKLLMVLRQPVALFSRNLYSMTC